jgi:hypothetical protein
MVQASSPFIKKKKKPASPAAMFDTDRLFFPRHDNNSEMQASSRHCCYKFCHGRLPVPNTIEQARELTCLQINIK